MSKLETRREHKAMNQKEVVLASGTKCDKHKCSVHIWGMAYTIDEFI